MISPRRRDEIVDALRRGTVPQGSLDAFAVGLGAFEGVLDEELRKVSAGGSVFKAVRGEYGCGKIMFTAYHTAEGGKYIGLTPQELVLMYLILDIGVCQEPYDVPPIP